MRSRSTLLPISLIVVLAGAGCAKPHDSLEPNPAAAPASTSGTPQIQPRWETCPAEWEDSQAFQTVDFPRLADDFQSAVAVVCRTDSRVRADGGTDAIVVEDRADDVTALVAALRLPDLPPSNTGCTLEGHVLPWLALLDDHDRWLRPRVPVDGCRKPRTEFTAAVEQLRTTPAASQVVGETTSATAARAGCQQRDSNAVTSYEGYPRDTFTVATADDASVSLCRYLTPPDQRDSMKPSGDFVAGERLSAERWPEIKRRIKAAGPAATCRRKAIRFALLRAPSQTFHVELDGCRRFLVTADAGPSVSPNRQASAELIALLD